jgi:hypothetical protein
MTDGLPTVRSTHRTGYLCVLVWCRADWDETGLIVQNRSSD